MGCVLLAGILKTFQEMGLSKKDNWNEKMPDIV
jgi:hypothetical protein